MALYLITGASSGIGEALSREAVRRGHSVYGVARRGELLDRLRDELGEAFVPFVCDVADSEAVAALCDRLPALPDVLLLNAGIGDFDNLHEIELALHRRTFEINYFGVVNVIAALFPRLKARGSGHVVAVSSLAGYRGLPQASAYSASKAAVTAAIEGMRLTYGRFGILFSAVHPGFVKTPMTSVNKGPMPFLWTADKAANYILRGVERRCLNIVFPLPLRILTAISWLLPARLHLALLGLKGKPRAPKGSGT